MKTIPNRYYSDGTTSEDTIPICSRCKSSDIELNTLNIFQEKTNFEVILSISCRQCGFEETISFKVNPERAREFKKTWSNYHSK